jgi:hypothetical protein
MVEDRINHTILMVEDRINHTILIGEAVMVVAAIVAIGEAVMVVVAIGEAVMGLGGCPRR